MPATFPKGGEGAGALIPLTRAGRVGGGLAITITPASTGPGMACSFAARSLLVTVFIQSCSR